MQYISINSIKPDPNQPRRTFNEEKMKALEASIKSDGFREQYPIIVDKDNIIIDGERRYRASKAVGLKEVPVEVKENVGPAERLLYQLQSEGAEIDFIERNKAWVNLWKLSQKFETKKSLSDKLGVPESTFYNILRDYDLYEKALGKLSTQSSAAEVSYETMVELGGEDKEVIEKATKEKWTRDKTREIKRAIKDKPLRREQILSQDYSDPYEGSSQWKMRLEVAKSPVDIKQIEDLNQTRQHMEQAVDAFDRIIEHGLKMQKAMEEFDYTEVTPQTRARLHRSLLSFVPYATEYRADLEKYMIENGELDDATTKKVNG